MDLANQSLLINFLVFALGAAAVWIAGTKLSGYVDEYAERSGMGKAFAGALILGVMLMSLIALASAAIISGELWSLAGVGLWPVLLFVAYLASLWTIYKYEGNPRWKPHGEVGEPPESAADIKDAKRDGYVGISTKSIMVRFAFASLAVLIGGYFVAKAVEAIAEQTGIGQNFVGATLVAVATSLPEVSTTFSAVRFGAYSMAAANILGTNSLEIALFLPADVAYRDGSIIDAMEPSACFLASLGIIVTGLYLWGILERRDRVILGMGYDSFWVICVYTAGITLYYFI